MPAACRLRLTLTRLRIRILFPCRGDRQAEQVFGGGSFARLCQSAVTWLQLLQDAAARLQAKHSQMIPHHLGEEDEEGESEERRGALGLWEVKVVRLGDVMKIREEGGGRGGGGGGCVTYF
ncbi:unnamed protein product [Pleuronectes platessa]|uniref:Uncharacterized protein n=1 Tax=Pleuronectes platessa TaxID=8262 RepID=A0A9N7YEL0_PLEPL|nr:unnamed protein product [Pleuronectes platessa]